MKYKEIFRINFKESISNYKKIKETLKSDVNMIFKFVMFFCYIFLQAMGKSEQNLYEAVVNIVFHETIQLTQNNIRKNSSQLIHKLACHKPTISIHGVCFTVFFLHRQGSTVSIFSPGCSLSTLWQ